MGIISKIKELKNVTLKVFEKLCNSGVCPIMDNSAGVGAFMDTIFARCCSTQSNALFPSS